MAIFYNVGQRVNPRDLLAPRKFYAITRTQGETTLRELVDEITDLSSLSSGDVMSVLEQFIKLVPKHLLKGQIVRLGDFGSFDTTTSSFGVDSEEDFNESFIKKSFIRFKPGRIIKNTLKNIEYKKLQLN